MKIAGYVLRSKSANETELSIIACTDIKGLVPKFLVNMFSAKAPYEWVTLLRESIKKRRK